MKTLSFFTNPKNIVQIVMSTFTGGLIGFGIELWRGNEFAVLLCAFAAGMSAMARLRRQQQKHKTIEV